MSEDKNGCCGQAIAGLIFLIILGTIAPKLGEKMMEVAVGIVVVIGIICYIAWLLGRAMRGR